MYDLEEVNWDLYDGKKNYSDYADETYTKSDKPKKGIEQLFDGAVVETVSFVPFISDIEEIDTDNDGLSDEEETNIFGTIPRKADTDGDELSDGLEVKLWYDPLNVNPDNDSFDDKAEYENDTSPYVYDYTLGESSVELLKGALLGDFDIPDTIPGLTGQVAASFIPFGADLRDYFANLLVNQDTGAAIFNVAGFLTDFFTVAGVSVDAVKVVAKIEKFVTKFSKNAAKALEAIKKISTVFPSSDKFVPAFANAVPSKTLDEMVSSINYNNKITQTERKTLGLIFEATGKNVDEAFGFISKNANEINFKPQKLMDELASSGKKFTLEKIEFVVKTPQGELLWLEYGNEKAGLHHILYGSKEKPGHLSDFSNRGITDVKSFIYQVLQSTPVNTGQRVKDGEIQKWAQYIVDDEEYLLAYGDNGFIVSFYPFS